MKYACKLAKTESLGIILLYIIQDENFRHWKGVENIMREEQKSEAKEVLEKYLKAYARINKTFISNSNRVVTQKSSLLPEKVASWDPTFSPSRTTSNRILF